MRTYVAENAVMLGEEWDRRHARYYVDLIKRYQVLPLERWPEIDVEWGNMYKGLDWCAERIERLWQASPADLVADPAIDRSGLELPEEVRDRTIFAWPATMPWPWHYVSGGIRPAACAGLPWRAAARHWAMPATTAGC